MDLFKLVLGVPNGSLLNQTLLLLKKIGIDIVYENRVFETEVESSEIISKVKFYRPQDIPVAVKKGVVDAGICGWDCIKEARMERRLSKITELNYSKKTKNPVDIVLFCKTGSGVDTGDVIDDEDVSVTSEYPNLTSEIFKKATITFSHGSTEPKVSDGLYDYGVCVTETGESLERNGLKIIKRILLSPTVLVSKKKTDEIVFFGELLKGALNAEKYQLLKMNVDSEIKDKVIEVLPALLSPTIESMPKVKSLAKGAYAVETVVEKSKAANLIVELQKLGASGILMTDINVLIP